MDKIQADAIKQIIEKAYIQGIHQQQDSHIANAGFHDQFSMLVKNEDGLEKVQVEEWLNRIETMKSESPDLWEMETTYSFKLIDTTNDAAVAKLDLFKGSIHFSTDYMLMYKFQEGWKIVSKIFTVPGK